MVCEFSTQNPKQLRYLPYTPGDRRNGIRWMFLTSQLILPLRAVSSSSVFQTLFCKCGRPFVTSWCMDRGDGSAPSLALPEETALSHHLFTAALESQRTGQTIQA